MDDLRTDRIQRWAVSALLCDCEAICSSGVLTEDVEMALRKSIAATERAFGVPSKAERAA